MLGDGAARQGAKALLRDIRASLQAQRTDQTKQKALLQVAEQVFGGLEQLEQFRTELEDLFAHDGLPVRRPARDHFDIYPAEVLTVLSWTRPQDDEMPYAPYLAAAYIAQVEMPDGGPASPNEWRTIFQSLLKVPLEYLDEVFDGSDEIFPYTLVAAAAWWEDGLTARYARELTIRNKALPDLGYTLAEALRLQEAGVEPLFANLVYYQTKGPALETALALSGAGVPYGYAHAMLQAGIPYATIAEMHLFQVPLEYALMMANVGRMDG